MAAGGGTAKGRVAVAIENMRVPLGFLTWMGLLVWGLVGTGVDGG